MDIIGKSNVGEIFDTKPHTSIYNSRYFTARVSSFKERKQKAINNLNQT